MGTGEVHAFLTHLALAEVQAVVHDMSGIHLLVARLLYGSGICRRAISLCELPMQQVSFFWHAHP
jgi:hypothetical protein